MAQADIIDITSQRARSQGPALFHTPLGYSTQRPDVGLPPLDRRALMQNAHQIARRYRPYTTSYAAALAYGLKAAWQQVDVARSIASLNAQVARREVTGAEVTASRAATRRCGSSYIAA
jgi:hypothetical protein